MQIAEIKKQVELIRWKLASARSRCRLAHWKHTPAEYPFVSTGRPSNETSEIVVFAADFHINQIVLRIPFISEYMAFDTFIMKELIRTVEQFGDEGDK